MMESLSGKGKGKTNTNLLCGQADTFGSGLECSRRLVLVHLSDVDERFALECANGEASIL